MNVFDLAARLTLDSSAFEKGLNGAKTAASNIGGALKTGFGVAATAVTAATTAVAGFTGAAVKTGASFDQAMSQVAATMGKTTGEIKNLRDFAQEMGQTTQFSATEAAQALNYMALAGYDAETSMKMLPNVLSLAAAGGMDLARASDVVTDAQSALGLSLDETNILVDQMAKAASTGNTSVAQLGEAILTVGGTANSMAGGTKELSAALTILADNGMKGAEGGTHLRNILLALQAPTDKQAKILNQLGISAYDATGKAKPLNQVLDELNDATSQMSQEERNNIISKLFNKTDLGIVNSLLGTSKERWEEVYAAIDDSQGAAEKMAKTQLDNLAGDVTLMKSAFEGLQIAISDKVTPTLRDFVKLGGTTLQDMAKAMKEGGVPAMMKVLSDAMTDFIDLILKTLPKLVDTGVQLLGAIGEGIMNNIDKLVDAAGKIGTTLLDALVEGVPKFQQFAMDVILKIGDAFASGESTIIPKIATLIGKILTGFTSRLGDFIELGTKLIKGFADGMSKVNPTETINKMVSDIRSAITEKLPDFLQAGINLLKQLAQGIKDTAPDLIKGLGDILSDLVKTITDALPDFIQAVVDIITAIVEQLPTLIQTIIDILPDIIENICQPIIKSYPILLKGVTDLILSLAKALPGLITSIAEAIPQIITSLVNVIIECLPQLIHAAIELVKGIVDALPDIIVALIKAILILSKQ